MEDDQGQNNWISYYMSGSVRNVTPVTVPVGKRDNGKRGKMIGEQSYASSLEIFIGFINPYKAAISAALI